MGAMAEAVGALNGLIGDTLDERGHRLAIRMRLRPDGDPTPVLVVLLHGLMATDDRWRFKGDPEQTYGSLLAADRGATPVYVSYNSGRHISVNGRELADRLEELVDGWPVPVEEVNLVGHSMGGLVARSAVHYATVDDMRWAHQLRRLFLLGAPNRGASLEQVAHHVNAALQALPVGVVQALGRLVDRRSAGIKDLRRGSLVDEDWQLSRRHPPAMPEDLAVYVACASVVGGGGHPVSRVLGDVLVSQFSAQGRRPLRPGTLCEEECIRVFSCGHLGLANNPAVYDQILQWWPAGAPIVLA